MTKIYDLTKQIHQLIEKINEKYGLIINIKYSGYVHDCLFPEPRLERYKEPVYYQIKPHHIRHILLSLSDTLDENYFNQETANEEAKQQNYFSSAELSDAFERGYYSCLLNFHHKTIAEALCQKWLDGFNPMIDTDPEKVLSELLEVLENLIK